MVDQSILDLSADAASGTASASLLWFLCSETFGSTMISKYQQICQLITKPPRQLQMSPSYAISASLPQNCQFAPVGPSVQYSAHAGGSTQLSFGPSQECSLAGFRPHQRHGHRIGFASHSAYHLRNGFELLEKCV